MSFRSYSSCQSTSSSVPSRGSRSVGGGGGSKKRLHGKWVFLTYATCSLVCKEDFIGSFSEMLMRNKLDEASFYGCRELHSNGQIHFHVLVNLGRQVNWSLSKSRNEKFMVAGNTCESLNISLLRRGQSIGNYVDIHVRYVEKNKDTFGDKPEGFQSKALECKKLWVDVGQVLDKDEKLQVVKDRNPAAFYTTFPAIFAAVSYEKELKGVYERYEVPRGIYPRKFVKPPVIAQWEMDNLVFPVDGRRQCLLIIGETRTGKSEFAKYLASSHGAISTFDTIWDRSSYVRGQVCAVFDDMQKGFPYWKGVFGCRGVITTTCKYWKVERLEWGVPSIWCCTRDNDPRGWDETVRFYIRETCVVYEIPVGSALFLGYKGGRL